MSSRKSSSGGDSLSFSRSGERIPLKSLQNENLHHSIESPKVKKSVVSSEVLRQTKENVSLHGDQKNAYASTTEEIYELADVTYKSFTCAGGEVEVFNSSLCTEESIVLPLEQAINSTPGAEDTVYSDSMIVQSCDEHTEHPYFNTCVKDATTLAGDALCLSNIFCTGSAELDNQCATKRWGDVTWKSYVCDGGEVEILQDVIKADDTIPLPQPGLSEYTQEQTFDTSNVCDLSDNCYCEGEEIDHPYCSRESAVASVTSESGGLLDTPTDGLGAISLKYLNCMGGEIEITDSTKHNDLTVLLPADQSGTGFESYNNGLNSSLFTEECDVDHLDHPYCNAGTVHSLHVINQPSIHEAVHKKELTNSKLECKKAASLISSEVEIEHINGSIMPETVSFVPEEQSCEQQVCQPLATDTMLKPLEDHIQDMSCKSIIENGDEGVNSVPPVFISTPSSQTDESVNTQHHEAKEALHSELSAMSSSQHSSETITVPSTDAEKQEATHSDTQVHSSIPPCHASDTNDSALGSSHNAPAPSVSTDQPETLPDVFKALSVCPTVASALRFEFFSPVVRKASFALIQAQRELAADHFVDDDCALTGDKSLVAPVDVDNSELWREHLDSPLPRPLFNSTALVHRPQPFAFTEKTEDVLPCAVPQPEANRPVLDVPLISEGPLQQQLRQMAEFLLLASGKVGPTAVSAPTASPVKAEYHNACVGTTPPKLVDHSLNTSGQFERKRDFSVADQCTLTDPLLWNVLPGSLESLPRPELEQRLLSSMIMVEALVQQLAAAQAPRSTPAGVAPSELREKLVQTEHTELSQTSMHRDLYLTALNRITELETDDSTLQNLVQCMQNVKITTTSLTSDTNAALCQLKQIEDVVREDHQSLVFNYGQMKSLLEKSRESQIRMIQKVKDALQQREDMHTQMEEAFSAKEAAFNVMDQLRKHCSMEISELEKCVGSQQELLSTLNKAHPEQVALNKAYSETLDSASELLSKTMEEQSHLTKELCTVRGLLQKCTPILLKLNEKADAALRDRNEHIAERDQAVQDKEQIEEQHNQALLNLQAAKEQIGDLNLQVTILTSEMGVLRQKLSEGDKERAQLDMKATELSATVSSTFASYAFLEQALTSETTKLQQSWKDIQQARDRAEELEMSLDQSQQRVCELSEALAQSEEQLESQAVQLQQLQDLCTQLSGVREMNEFLQMENELAREQMAESEHKLRANLQSLRERNIQCEDLNGELCQLQHENKNLREELDSTKASFSASQVEHREKLTQAVTEITILHHTLRGLTDELHASLKEEKPDQVLHPAHSVERRHPSSSFVDSIMVALTNEKEEENSELVSSDVAEPQRHTLFSETSAFTRITATTPKKNSPESEPEEEQSNVSELLAGLDSTVTELSNTLAFVQQRKDAQLEERHNTICRLQRELEAANSAHQTEVSELQYQLSRLNAQVEKGNVALQQKSQDDKTMSKLVSEISEVQEMLNKHKADNNELRKEVVELRRSLQQSKSEGNFLRDELRKKGGHSSNPAHFMEEKIGLLKEVERLKASLQEEEQARNRLLERAKRHQVIYQTNQQKSEKELQMLNNMINKVREILRSLPAVVRNCQQLQQLIDYIG